MSMLLVRQAVRADLALLEPGDRVIAACSGGADSIALTAALLLESKPRAISVATVTIDHQLQEGSGRRAKELVAALESAGANPVEAIAVEVGSQGGPEAAARTARYQALNEAADRLGASAIYLAHTASDQAESVLLGLARGSGTRSLSGMAAVADRYRRPLLGLTREQVRQAAAESALAHIIWEDPHNRDSRFLRSRVRSEVMPMLERVLGPGVEAALVRSAQQLRDDADALDALAAQYHPGESIDALELADLPRAVRSRVVLRFLRERGVGALTFEHIDRVDALIAQWRGQGAVALPGGARLERRADRLFLEFNTH